MPVSRALYMATNNCLDMDSAIQVLHKCDNPPCCNIDHLFVGTQKDNVQDMISKGRMRKVDTYKLHTRQRIHSDDKIRAIREAIGKLEWIAQDHGVSISYVSKIKSMKAKTLV